MWGVKVANMECHSNDVWVVNLQRGLCRPNIVMLPLLLLCRIKPHSCM